MIANSWPMYYDSAIVCYKRALLWIHHNTWPVVCYTYIDHLFPDGTRPWDLYSTQIACIIVGSLACLVFKLCSVWHVSAELHVLVPLHLMVDKRFCWLQLNVKPNSPFRFENNAIHSNTHKSTFIDNLKMAVMKIQRIPTNIQNTWMWY